MLWARALSKGANRIGSDLLLGLYCTEEMFDTFGKAGMQVTRDDDGQIKEVIDTEHVEVVR